jgi:hypothetical protein
MNEKEENAKKSWREAKRIGLQFYGWKQGVPMWRGSWKKGAPLWFCRMFLGLSGLMLTLLIAFQFLLAGKDRLIANAVLFPETILFGFLTALMYGQRRRIQSLRSKEEIVEQLGVDAEEMERLAENNKIKPRYIINDEPMYDLTDFGEAGILLRGSSAPVLQETLLRAATGQTETPQEELLRASAAEEANRAATAQAEEERLARILLGGGRKE